jgi:DNA-binding CsgD family transcriptional regulator
MAMNASPMPALPLIGRERELVQLHSLLDDAAAGRGRTLLLAGESGLGKSRLVRAATDEAQRRAWQVAVGRAYPVESGVPYAPISDGLLPLLRQLSPEALSVLTRGGETELFSLFPALRPADLTEAAGMADAPEFKARLLWNFTQFLGRLCAKKPLLLVIEDLQWADSASLEVLHFAARQFGHERIALLCTYNDAHRVQNPMLRRTEQSLLGLHVARVLRLAPLSRAETDQLVREVFGTDALVTREFSALLFGWTRGNPFFVEETLKALVQSGRLHQHDGRWLGWEVDEIELPRSVRDAVLERLDRLSPEARALADLHSVVGTSATYETLRSICGLDEERCVAALDELRRSQIVAERMSGSTVVFDFSHPILRETLYTEMGMARARLLHGSVAEALERRYGDAATVQADELAYHFSRAGASHLAEKATRYLTLAGRNALTRHAYQEAVNYLGAALDRADQAGTEIEPRLIEDLARARQRVGEYDAAIALWERARDEAHRHDDPAWLAATERRLGLAHHWSGRCAEALAHYDTGLAAAARARDEGMEARLRLAKGHTLQELGRPDDASGELRASLALAEQQQDPALLSRVHRTLLLLHTLTGPPDRAREHGVQALRHSEQTGDHALACAAHWALAAMEGLTGHLDAMARHIQDAERLADEIRSPLHRLWVNEISLEYLSAIGQWDAGQALAERSIAQARAFRQGTLLPRLLVWSSLIYLHRGDLPRGTAYVEEAWKASRAGATDRALDVHTVVPAHTGRAALHLARAEYAEAARVGEAGLEIADRSGYTVWAIHRLLPIIGEAYVSMLDFGNAERIGQRLRADSERMGHEAGIAWADASDALVVWLANDLDRAVGMLRHAAERLEAIPVVFDAARVRRQLAARLRDAGDPDGALRELRQIHEVFARLGAERELQKTREQIRELGARPPARDAGTGGAAGLTPREVEIVRLVALRKSNKAIGQALDISARTVSTHLSHIFRKLSVSSRGELAEMARTLELPE